MRGRTPASHMRARRTMWWTLPFLLFFFLLALFAFLLFQRTSHSLSGAGSVPASAIHVEPHADIFNYDGDTEPDRATSSQQEQQQQKIDSPPAEEAAPPDTAVAPPPPVEATPSPEVAKEQHSAPLHGVEEDHKRRVLVVASADDLEATLASEKADRLALADRSDQGTPLEKHLVEVGREPSGRDKGAILGVYRQCRTPDNAEAKLMVYFCNEKADPEHWARCVVNAWNVQQLVGTSIPPIKTIAAWVEPSAWGMALLEVLFPGVGFTVAPSPEKCVNVDQSALQLWRAEDSAVPGFWSSEVASAFKRLFYDRVQRPPHTQLPDQVTLLVQKNAVIVNELGLANLLSQVTGMQVVVVDLDQLSVWDQIRLTSNTGILVGMHGPGFVNSIFLPRGAVVVELFGGRYYNSMYSVLAASSGATTLAYHEPDIASVTASLEDQASELMVSSSFQATAQKALQAWRDNNQLHYRAIKKA